MKEIKRFKLKYNDIKIKLSPKEIGAFKKQDKISGIIGQPRALKALQMGIGIKARGYNIFVTGLSGTGKRTAIKKILRECHQQETALNDILFVHNFIKEDTPMVLSLPAGKGKVFKKEIHQVVETLKSNIKAKLEDKWVQTKKDRIVRLMESVENKTLSQLETRLAKDNFHIVQVENGEDQVTDITPIYKGQAVNIDDLSKLVASGELSEKYLKRVREKYYTHMDSMKKIFKDLQINRKKSDDKLKIIDMEAIKPVVKEEIDRVVSLFDYPDVKKYLKAMEEDINVNSFLFTLHPEELEGERSVSFSRYGVNVAVDNSGKTTPPIVFENHPTHANLIGTIESRMEASGVVKSGFMMIRAGSLLQASGGYLILYADDILREGASWQKLKNILLTEKVEIFHPENMFMSPGMKLKTRPVKVDVKVIIIGSAQLYDVLFSMDQDFHKLFKISAEFDSVIPCNSESIGRYTGFIKKIIDDEKLKKINARGIVKVLEYGMRLAEEKNFLSTRFSKMADIIREADYWASCMNKKVIDHEAVNRAVAEKNYLFNLPEEKLSNMINSGEILLSVSGQEVGKINGLAVYDRGYYSFGRPTRITAQVSPGDNGVINIERESGLSGEFHDKGVLIIEGYLRSTYAMDFPLAITASICFEQSYSNIEGDSASSTEVYALLSSIAGVPLRQDIAVTGSVNQMGDIQPIGGVTEKVEGFFRVCKDRGLTGTQGVIIPEQNIKNLILCDEVLEAIKAKEFHIYSIKHINDGMEILTGIPSGKRRKDFTYTPGSLNEMICKRLKELAMVIKDFGVHHDHEDHHHDGPPEYHHSPEDQHHEQ